MIEFKGRTAFVTGGANGIGIGIVRALLAEGCRVAIADIRQDHIERALKSFDNQMVMGIHLDVASREEMHSAADKVEARFGPVSLLFNNAGVNLFQPIEESSLSDWDWVMGVNLHGPINGVMTFVPRMIANGQGGYIVNTASMSGWLASGSPGIYNTTKFAVRGMSESLRYSLAKYGIGVSILCPGLVKSHIHASDSVRPQALMAGARPVDEARIRQLAEFHELGMEPDVIAARVLDGIRNNRAYIFSHPEFREELAGLFDEYLADFHEHSDDPGYEKRLGFEALRRERYKEARDAARHAT